MATLLTESAASAVLALDEADEATLTELAQASGRSLSTIQRAGDGLVKAEVVTRAAPRSPFRLTDSAPRRALRELAEWRLGTTSTKRICAWARRRDERSGIQRAPATVRDPRIRAAWSDAIDRIVMTVHPERIVLFGSQARGDARPDSDVDLLVVVAGDIDRRAVGVAVTRLLADMPFAKDVIVARPEDLIRPLRGSALAEAVRDGVTVYQR